MNKKRCAIEEVEKDDDDDENIVTLNDRVFFYADVSVKNILKLIKCLHQANQYCLHNLYEPVIYLYINSYGGDLFAGLSGMDHIRLNTVKIITIADGYVASAATFLLLAGFEKKSLTNARILIHQLSTEFEGKYNDLLSEMNNSKELMKTLENIYLTNTNFEQNDLKQLLGKELHLNSIEAHKYGIIDEIW